MNTDAPTFDPAAFSTTPYVKRVEKPWGYELHWVPQSLPYMGKIIHLNAGKRWSLQLHDQKQESWMIMQGRAMLTWQNEKGELIDTELEPGKGYTCALGQQHRITAITDCDIIEVSTSELGTTWRLEDDYARSNETPEERGKRDREATLI